MAKAKNKKEHSSTKYSKLNRKTKRTAKARVASKKKTEDIKASTAKKDTSAAANKPDGKPNMRQQKSDDLWNMQFEALKKFKKEKGHTLVPKMYKENQTLAYWVQRTRKSFILYENGDAKSTMTAEKLKKLKDIDFCFRAKGIPLQAEVDLQRVRERSIKVWNQRVKELHAYKIKHGNCLVPKVYPQNKPLSSWVYNQRYQYKKRNDGGTVLLNDDRIKQLEALGFCWNAKADKAWQEKDRAKKYKETQGSWNAKYELLKEFKKKHGHCNVPKIYRTNPSLSSWVFRQRRMYSLRQDGSPHALGDDRLEKLEKIEFSFRVKSLKRREKSTGASKEPKASETSTTSDDETSSEDESSDDISTTSNSGSEVEASSSINKQEPEQEYPLPKKEARKKTSPSKASVKATEKKKRAARKKRDATDSGGSDDEDSVLTAEDTKPVAKKRRIPRPQQTLRPNDPSSENSVCSVSDEGGNPLTPEGTYLRSDDEEENEELPSPKQKKVTNSKTSLKNKQTTKLSTPKVNTNTTTMDTLKRSKNKSVTPKVKGEQDNPVSKRYRRPRQLPTNKLAIQKKAVKG